jgi:hypothetical protein
MRIIKGVENMDNNIYQISIDRTELEMMTLDYNLKEPMIIEYRNIEIE